MVIIMMDSDDILVSLLILEVQVDPASMEDLTASLTRHHRRLLLRIMVSITVMDVLADMVVRRHHHHRIILTKKGMTILLILECSENSVALVVEKA
jgi:hypothetical protein